MNTDLEKLEKEIFSFLKTNVENMLDKHYVDEGTTYYLRLPNQLGIVLLFDSEGYLEASVRVRDSSYFIDDWQYIDEGSFVGIDDVAQVDGIVEYFMKYVEAEEERSEVIDDITTIMFGENITEFSVERKDGSRLRFLYNLRDLSSKIVDENEENVTYNVDVERLRELYKDLKEDYLW